MKDRNNPWVNAVLTIWQDTVKKCGLTMGVRMLRWCAYDTDFVPKDTDSRFKSWIDRGISTYYTLVDGGAIMSFEFMKEKFGLGQSDFFRFLQLIHYMTQNLSTVLNIQVSGLVMVFLKAGESQTCTGIISRLYRGLRQAIPDNTLYILEKWEREGNCTISVEEWEKSCEIVWETTCSNMWREFNWKNQVRYFITPAQKKYSVDGMV